MDIKIKEVEDKLEKEAVSREMLYDSNFAHQKRSTDLENTDFMPMKILSLCTFS